MQLSTNVPERPSRSDTPRLRISERCSVDSVPAVSAVRNRRPADELGGLPGLQIRISVNLNFELHRTSELHFLLKLRTSPNFRTFSSNFLLHFSKREGYVLQKPSSEPLSPISNVFQALRELHPFAPQCRSHGFYRFPIFVALTFTDATRFHSYVPECLFGEPLEL